jgi:hypothetical protein
MSDLLAWAIKMEKWLNRVAKQSSTNAAANRGRFDSLADAEEADAKNYIAMATDARRAIAKAQRKERKP